jgi:hypothetical protein
MGQLVYAYAQPWTHALFQDPKQKSHEEETLWKALKQRTYQPDITCCEAARTERDGTGKSMVSKLKH